MKAIIRRDTKESYPEFVKRLAEDSGIKEPTEEEARRFDAKRRGKKMSNKEWQSSTDGDACIAKLKDGRTRMAYKSEHAVDLKTEAIVGVTIQPADCSDTATVQETLQVNVDNLHNVHNVDVSDSEDDGQKRPSRSEDRPTDKPGLVADKGYHKAVLLRWLKEKGYRTYIHRRGDRRAISEVIRAQGILAAMVLVVFTMFRLILPPRCVLGDLPKVHRSTGC
jgi:transposase